MKKVFIILGMLNIYGCGDLLDSEGDTQVPFTSEQRSLDGVKLISPSITDEEDPSSYTQLKYSLNSTSRLIMRFESLTDDARDVVIDDENRMTVEISLVEDQDIINITNEMELCPLSENWMMYATWYMASFVKKWNQEGGSYLVSECISSLASSEEDDENKLIFDVSDWYGHYQQSRDQNFGWILISSNPVQIYGDTHISKAPKLKWIKVHN